MGLRHEITERRTEIGRSSQRIIAIIQRSCGYPARVHHQPGPLVIARQADREVLDILRLPPEELQSLLDALDNDAPPAADLDAAGAAPRAYRSASGVIAMFEGTPKRYLVYPRSLSPGSMHFLHGGFVYPKSTCQILLRVGDREKVLAVGKIAQCRSVRGRIHEVTVAFNAPINVPGFVKQATADVAATPAGRTPPTYDVKAASQLVADLQRLVAAGASADELLELATEFMQCLCKQASGAKPS